MNKPNDPLAGPFTIETVPEKTATTFATVRLWDDADHRAIQHAAVLLVEHYPNYVWRYITSWEDGGSLWRATDLPVSAVVTPHAIPRIEIALD